MKEKIQNVKKEQIIIFVVGLLIGLLTMVIFYPERIAELKNGEEVAITIGKNNITADTVYKDLKERSAIGTLLELIDKTILENKYELTEEDYTEIDTTATNYISSYTSYYQITEEEFLNQNGFKTKDEFKKYLELDYMRNKYFQEYLNGQMTEEELNDYYNNKTFGTINTQHILVKTSSTMSDENAKAKIEEILNKLKNGTSWDDLKKEYKNDITTEDVTVNFDSNLEAACMTEAKNLKDGAYSTSPVKTSYGYHIVYRVGSDEKPDFKTFEERIRTMIIQEKTTADTKLYEKVLIKMREEEKTEIKDTELKKAYDEYVNEYK